MQRLTAIANSQHAYGRFVKGKKNVKRNCKMDVFRGLCTSVCRAYANAYGYVRKEE